MKRWLILLFLFSTHQAYGAKNYCGSPEFKGFDFWLGSWDVKTKDNKTAGKNVIKRVNPCLILESWLGAKGLKGSSINYYETKLKKWVQHWVSGDGTIIHLAGNAKQNTMKMEGTIFYAKSGKTFPFRGEWMLLADKRVRQYFEQQDLASKQWKPWFEGFYTKTGKSSH